MTYYRLAAMTYDPLPTVQTAYSGHPRKGVAKDPTECTGKYSTSEKDCYSLIDLFLLYQLHVLTVPCRRKFKQRLTRLYQPVKKKFNPGKRPASKIPKQNLSSAQYRRALE
jgi:hypothetical protein